MSKVICVAGESGSGKTTSMRNLDPKTTLYIDCDKKGLSWKGWRSQYNSENQNYIKTDFAQVVQQTLQKVDKVEKWKHIKVVVIDTINGLMVSDEMRRSKEKGYDKWVDLAACVWDLVNEAYEYRDDLTIIFTAHTQTDHDENGYICLPESKLLERSWTRLSWKANLQRFFSANAWMGNINLRPRQTTALQKLLWEHLKILKLTTIL